MIFELPDKLLGVVSPQPALFIPFPRLFQLCKYIIVSCYLTTIRIDIYQSSRNMEHCHHFVAVFINDEDVRLTYVVVLQTLAMRGFRPVNSNKQQLDFHEEYSISKLTNNKITSIFVQVAYLLCGLFETTKCRECASCRICNGDKNSC